MVQQRFHRAWASTFEQAVEAKKIFTEENPEGNYQIRRRRYNYEIVIRLTTTQIKQRETSSKKG